LEGQVQYVKACLLNEDTKLFGIFDSKKHIGNIQINGLLSIHRCAELTYVIGDKSYWGKGVASYAISETIKKCTNEYKLNKLIAGLAKDNVGSAKVLEKNGFKLEGVRKNHLFYNGHFHDQHDYGLILKK